jgi:hypothetical protein
MKKAHVLGLALFAVFAFSVMAVASASATTLQWLAKGEKITSPLLSDAEGEIELGNNKAPLLGLVSVLCSGIFDGTVGPGAEDLITEVLNLSNEAITLAKPVSCTNVSQCPKPTVAPENLPWLTELELMGTETTPLFLNKILNGGKGEPTWWVMCEEEPIVGLAEEECAGPASTNIENDAAENDVLATFSKAEAEAEGALALCSGNKEKTGFVNTAATDAVGLLLLTSGEALSVSYE